MAKERTRVGVLHVVTAGICCSARCPQKDGPWCKLFDRYLNGLNSNGDMERKRCYPCNHNVRAPKWRDAAGRKVVR